MPNIAVINESMGATDSEIQAMLPAFGQQWNADLKAIWGVDDANFTFHKKGVKPMKGSWWLVFLDTSDQPEALAYHDLTDEGLPISKVFVKTIRADNSSLSVGATHELCEMAVDPWLNSGYQDPNGTFWAGEVCDPVEDDEYAYKIGDILVTDFVTPDWFAHEHSHGPVDFKSHTKKSFEILSGGYAQFFDPQKGWQQVTGNRAVRSRRADPPIGSRRERRARRFKTKECMSSTRFS
jgi:hypothetical protein